MIWQKIVDPSGGVLSHIFNIKSISTNIGKTTTSASAMQILHILFAKNTDLSSWWAPMFCVIWGPAAPSKEAMKVVT